MLFRNLSIEEFTNYSNNHPFGSFYQTVNYGIFMAEHGYDYELVGLLNENDEIIAASLILIKTINNKFMYGYAPRGFLLDYENEYILRIFTEKLKDYCSKKSIIFVKINPNVSIGEVSTDFNTIYNAKRNIAYSLNRCDYKKLLDNLYFESQLPRFNPIVDLSNYNYKNLNKNTRNKINKAKRKGLVFNKYPKDYLNNYYNLIKNNTSHSEFYYKDLYTAFEKNNSIDLFLVSIDYYNFLQNSQDTYDKEANKNNYLNNRIVNKNNDKVFNAKMNSDRALLTYKNDIMEASKGMSENKEVFIAGAIVIKHNNTVTIFSSVFDKDYSRFAPNYFLYNSIIEYYKDENDYLDLNGVVGDFKNLNPYTGLNRFKMGFKPNIYEYLGEFDLIIEPKTYSLMLNLGILSKEFNKKSN